MTDTDIIKALECCIKNHSCQDCPLWREDISQCLETAATNALDLINRQKAEIERLTEKVEALGDPLEKSHYEISELKTENETLQKAIQVQEIMLGNQDYAIKKARAEAITEFEERLVSCGVKSVEVGHFDNKSYEFITIRKDRFDQIAEEVKEGVTDTNVGSKEEGEQ